MKSIKLLSALALLAGAGIAGATTTTTVTGVPGDVPSVVVKYGDLNLATSAGVARLHARIRNAAESLCAPLETRVLGLRDQYDACVSDATARGVADVNNANLSIYHRGGKAALVAAVRN